MFEDLHPGLEVNLGSEQSRLECSPGFRGSPCEGGETFTQMRAKSVDISPKAKCWPFLPDFNRKGQAASVHAHLAWQVQSLLASAPLL